MQYVSPRNHFPLMNLGTCFWTSTLRFPSPSCVPTGRRLCDQGMGNLLVSEVIRLHCSLKSHISHSRAVTNNSPLGEKYANSGWEASAPPPPVRSCCWEGLRRSGTREPGPVGTARPITLFDLSLRMKAEFPTARHQYRAATRARLCSLALTTGSVNISAPGESRSMRLPQACALSRGLWVCVWLHPQSGKCPVSRWGVQVSERAAPSHLEGQLPPSCLPALSERWRQWCSVAAAAGHPQQEAHHAVLGISPVRI